ncbi:unnamed protein product [Urochloa decumbens]|uniref:GPI-anchored protein LLG1-like domain-containing protein n=1 Tax=Urochloa decumbens TaxID=240449 RepID=A0ABC9CDE6_9POAL
MAADRRLLPLFLLSAAALAGVASAAGPFLSGKCVLVFLAANFAFPFAITSVRAWCADGVFQVSAGSTGRSLLQAKKDCPVNFEFQNYTIITSKCKGPKFPASQCCAALKEFACPFYMYLNDESNSCASTMFSYINLFGKYPPGLFSSECKEGKLGLSCADVPQRDISTADGRQHAQSSLLAWITVLSVLVALLFH